MATERIVIGGAFANITVVLQFVSERALAETYDTENGWETVTQYREAVRLRDQNPDMARAEIARRIGRPPSAVRGWLVEGKTPRVVTGIRTAKERGWINVDTESERFRALNQLVAWIFSGGGIARDTFVPHFSVDDPLMLAVLSQHLRWLQIGYRGRDPSSPEHHLEVVPAEGAAILGRVLSVLGAPRGVKAQLDELPLPSYLSNVDREHRRDFARIYLLNRGEKSKNSGTDGTYIQTTQTTPHSEALRSLFGEVTSGTATLGSQQRVWVSATAVRDLAGEKPLRPGLATAAVYGTLTPPTDRSLASTFRRSQTPSGYRYHQLYQTARGRDESQASLAFELGVSESTIQSWRRGSKPYVTNALHRANERGWLTPHADSEISTALIALLTWLLARGSLRETYYPVFGTTTPDQRERFESIAETLTLPFKTVRPDDPDWPTELRPVEGGALLGRILYALGTPRQSEPQTTALLPPIVYLRTNYAREVAEIWCLHHARDIDSESLTISIPPRVGEYAPDALEALFSEQLDWTIERQAPRNIVVTDPPDDLKTV